MKVAVEGCAHGELDKIYDTITALQVKIDCKIDLLIICGDFQSVRNSADLECMAVPPKYRSMNSFYKYYSGEKVAPILTIFVGGNHEASNYLSELPYGGWVAPNIYYMGYAGVVRVGNIRIAGLSGIYKGRDYTRGRFEQLPYDESSKKSIYHVRNVDVFRLKQISGHLDVCISHDWPRGIHSHGDVNSLLQKKPFFKEDIESNQLGSMPAQELLQKLKPSFWFAAHLHCKFTAIVSHENDQHTKFLALDKCLPRRKFLQVLDIGEPCKSPTLQYDPEWLAILESTDYLSNTSRRTSYMPGRGGSERWDFVPTNDELQEVMELFDNNFVMPLNFCITAPIHNQENPNSQRVQLKQYQNLQTTNFCQKLSISDLHSIKKDSFTISDFSGTDTDVSCYSSFKTNEASGSDVESDEEFSSFNQSSVISGTESISGMFVIDNIGESKSLDSSLFVIDTNGDRPSSSKTVEMDSFESARKSPEPSFNSKIPPTDVDASPVLELNHQTFLSPPLMSTPIAVTSKPQELFPELKEENLVPVIKQSEETTPVVKKFKRRNFALYCNEDQDA